MTAADKILVELLAKEPRAIHEFFIPGVSQTSVSARLREMKRDGLVQSHPVEGKRYTTWTLTMQGEARVWELLAPASSACADAAPRKEDKEESCLEQGFSYR